MGSLADRIERRADPAGRLNVVVLDEDAVEQTEPVVPAAAAANRVLVEEAQARSGLACVHDGGVCARYHIDKPAGHGGNAAHPLQEIERNSLTGEDGSRAPADSAQRLTGGDPFPLA